MWAQLTKVKDVFLSRGKQNCFRNMICCRLVALFTYLNSFDDEKSVFVIEESDNQNFNSLILDTAFRCFGILIAWISLFPELAHVSVGLRNVTQVMKCIRFADNGIFTLQNLAYKICLWFSFVSVLKDIVLKSMTSIWVVNTLHMNDLPKEDSLLSRNNMDQ